MEFKGYDKDFKITDQVVVITGGAMGLGYAIGKLFYEKGAKVVLLDLNDSVVEAAGQIGSDVTAIVMDVTKTADIDRALNEVMARYGRIEILCNVAGLGQLVPAEEMSEEEFDRIVAVNFRGMFFMAQRVGRIMIAAGKGGKIINMSSQAGNIGLWGHACYGPTKAAITNLTKVLAAEWGKHWINVNAISPTVIMTPMAKQIWSGAKGDAYLDKQPIHRFGQPEEVAACALFLASGAAGMITGENLVIDGGYSIV